MNKNECCNHDCNQGRDCPERRVTVRRSASERTMTHPIPGADSEPLYSSAKERAAFEAEYRANWGFQFAKDVLGCYEDYTMERDFQEWQRIPRAAAKVGANVADSINTHEFRRLAEAWSNAADIGPFSCFDPERTLAAWNALVAHIDARIAAGAPAETPKPLYFVRLLGESGWRESSEEAYWTFSERNRRIVYDDAQVVIAPVREG